MRAESAISSLKKRTETRASSLLIQSNVTRALLSFYFVASLLPALLSPSPTNWVRVINRSCLGRPMLARENREDHWSLIRNRLQPTRPRIRYMQRRYAKARNVSDARIYCWEWSFAMRSRIHLYHLIEKFLYKRMININEISSRLDASWSLKT